MYKLIQNLGVFVAEVQGEGFIRSTGSDYALLHEAARTIDRVLETLLGGTSAGDISSVGAQAPAHNDDAELPIWDLSATGDTLGYEVDFWRMLGEHPSLLALDDIAQEPDWLTMEI